MARLKATRKQPVPQATATKGRGSAPKDQPSNNSVQDAQLPPQEYNSGDAALVLYQGKWLPAKILKSEPATNPDNANESVQAYLIHYPKWSHKFDEWVMADSLMKDTPANRKIADTENALADKEASGQQKKTGRRQKRKTVENGDEAEIVPSTSKTQTKSAGKAEAAEPQNKRQKTKKAAPENVIEQPVAPRTSSRTKSEQKDFGEILSTKVAVMLSQISTEKKKEDFKKAVLSAMEQAHKKFA